jgi:hypothetical protein
MLLVAGWESRDSEWSALFGYASLTERPEPEASGGLPTSLSSRFRFAGEEGYFGSVYCC